MFWHSYTRIYKSQLLFLIHNRLWQKIEANSNGITRYLKKLCKYKKTNTGVSQGSTHSYMLMMKCKTEMEGQETDEPSAVTAHSQWTVSTLHSTASVTWLMMADDELSDLASADKSLVSDTLCWFIIQNIKTSVLHKLCNKIFSSSKHIQTICLKSFSYAKNQVQVTVIHIHIVSFIRRKRMCSILDLDETKRFKVIYTSVRYV